MNLPARILGDHPLRMIRERANAVGVDVPAWVFSGFTTKLLAAPA